MFQSAFNEIFTFIALQTKTFSFLKVLRKRYLVIYSSMRRLKPYTGNLNKNTHLQAMLL